VIPCPSAWFYGEVNCLLDPYQRLIPLIPSIFYPSSTETPFFERQTITSPKNIWNAIRALILYWTSFEPSPAHFDHFTSFTAPQAPYQAIPYHHFPRSLLRPPPPRSFFARHRLDGPTCLERHSFRARMIEPSLNRASFIPPPFSFVHWTHAPLIGPDYWPFTPPPGFGALCFFVLQVNLMREVATFYFFEK